MANLVVFRHFLTAGIIVICLTNGVKPSSEAEFSNNEDDVNEDDVKEEDNLQEEKRINPEDRGFDFTEDEIKKYKLWPQGNIPYFIDEFSFDKVLRDKIRLFLEKTSTLTGLQFLELLHPPESNSTRWVLFINRRGQLDCVDYTTKSFTITGVQQIVLGYNCINSGNGGLAAIILALAGVPPQHNAPNREKYIRINTSNIIPDKAHLFELVSDQDWLFHSLPYDFASAGHYDTYKFSSNGRSTISIEKSTEVPVGEAEGLSQLDIMKIRMLYNYIRQKQASQSLCEKLFRPGKNFKNYQAELTAKMPPLQRPLSHSKDDGADPSIRLKRPKKGSKQDKNKNNQKNKLSVMSDFDTSDG